MVSKFYELAKTRIFTHETTLNRGRRNQGNPMPSQRRQTSIRPPAAKRPIFKTSSLLSYTENDLAVMAKFAGNGKIAFAQQLFDEMTDSERKLQSSMQSSRFSAYPCHPQTIAFGYILDFYLPTVGLAIEVDGPIHENQKAADKKRDANLRQRGITTMRVKSHEVILDLDSVLAKIESKIAAVAALRR